MKHLLVLPLSNPKYEQNTPLTDSSLAFVLGCFLVIHVYFLLQLACADIFRAFSKLDTSFKGIINPNEVDKASGDVLEYLGSPIGCFPLP